MKIVYLSSAAIPNDWAHVIQIMKMSEAFGRKVELEVVTPRRVRANTADPFEYYHIEKNFEMTQVACIDLSSTSPSKFVFLVRMLSFLISARFYVSNNVKVYTRELYAALFFRGVFYEIHSLPKKITWAHRVLWARVGGFIVLTEQIKQRLVEQGIDARRIHVEPDAVDIEKFDINVSMQEARAQFSLPQNVPLIGYVGTLKTMSMEKGVGVAIKAFAHLPSQYRLCVVGGEKRDIAFYEKMAADAGVRHRVFFCGKVSHSEVPMYIKAFDIVVAPFPDHPHYRYYMSPLKIFEYMASKRPIITSDLESIKEVLDHTTAALIPPGDSNALSREIIRLYENKERSATLAQNAFNKVHEYTWDKRAERIVHFVTQKV